MLIGEHIIGPRVYLRTLQDTDATNEYCGWLNDPEVNAYLATKSAIVPELVEYINKKNQQPDALFFGIFAKENNTHIGTIKLEPIDVPNRAATIAIMVGNKKYWGLGMGAEAMRILIDYAQKKMGMQKIELGVIAQNTVAVRAYAKLGFKEIKRENQSVRYGAAIYDQVTMALIV